MALGPKEMANSIINNLEKKTGKNLEQWINLITKEGISNRKKTLAFLKKENGLGHFQASTIFDYMSAYNPYEHPDKLIKDQFSTAIKLNLFQKLSNAISSIAEDVQVRPCKTYVPFYRKNSFAVVYEEGNDLILRIKLPAGTDSELFHETKGRGSERLTYQTYIAKEDHITPTLLEMINLSYQVN